MQEEFIEYKGETIPYSTGEVCLCTTRYAKEYIKSVNAQKLNINNDVRDAVLVDFINYLGLVGELDFDLCTSDLLSSDKFNSRNVPAQMLLTVLLINGKNYIFKENMVESVLNNSWMNSCKEKFDINDGVKVIIDFINFVLEKNNYVRRFTIKEIYESFKKKEHEEKLEDLKKFLMSTEKYSYLLNYDVNIDKIFEDKAFENKLKYVSRSDIYYYTDYEARKKGRSKMLTCDRKK